MVEPQPLDSRDHCEDRARPDVDVRDTDVRDIEIGDEEALALLLTADPVSAGDMTRRLQQLAASLDEAAAEGVLGRLARLGLVRTAASDDGRTTYVRTTLGKEHCGAVLDDQSALTARLAELEQLRTDFVATIAHELKTPLTAIRTCVGLLTDSSAQADEEIRQRLLDRVSASAEGMQHLIENLLDLARYRAGRLQLERRWIDAGDVVRDVVALIGPLVEDRRQVIRLDVPASPVMVYADRRRIIQALGNIVSNAQKFSPAGATIEMTVREHGGEVTWEVRDSGPGISAEDQRLLFERFFRGRSDEGGSGLGLPIALATAQAHGGTITVDSKLGRGSTFRIALPRGEEDTAGGDPR